MDWNCDEKTTLGEFFISSDIGKRIVLLNSNSCVEYFSFKDGLTVKVNCQAGTVGTKFICWKKIPANINIERPNN